MRPVERTAQYTVLVPHTVQKKVQVQVCRLVEKTVQVPVCQPCCRPCCTSCCHRAAGCGCGSKPLITSALTPGPAASVRTPHGRGGSRQRSDHLPMVVVRPGSAWFDSATRGHRPAYHEYLVPDR